MICFFAIYFSFCSVFLDPNSNNNGYYELVAVLTHKGASVDSGHYVAWARVKKGTIAGVSDVISDVGLTSALPIFPSSLFFSHTVFYSLLICVSVGQWVMFDDDTVTLKTDNDILKLSGEGGKLLQYAILLCVCVCVRVKKVPFIYFCVH